MGSEAREFKGEGETRTKNEKRRGIKREVRIMVETER